MTPFQDLADRWELAAEELELYADERGAAIARLHAAELREAIRSHRRELLDPTEAAQASGYSRRTLRSLTASGKLRNFGKRGSPKYRRSDLPVKARNGDVEGVIEDAPDHRLSLEQAIGIAMETCRGLEFAHS